MNTEMTIATPMYISMLLIVAYLLDLVVGDPRSFPHPVVFMGKVIKWLENQIRKYSSRETSLKATGILLPFVLVTGSYLVVWAIIKMAGFIHPWLAFAVEAWLISTTIAVKGLKEAGEEIYQLLINRKLEKVRSSLSMIVGRDTESLNEQEVSRGAVETVAENTVDAVISPLFYAAIGGAPLAMAYRAVNTLDSMVGYKNERYLHLGWASARLDDLANYLPARLAGFILIIVSGLLRLNWKNAWKVMRRDARLHPSPNSGIMEAGVAGALEIQLGGTNYYQGIPSHRARMGDPVYPIQPKHIMTTIQIMIMVSLFSLFFFVAVRFIGFLFFVSNL